jgi:hypothetical protein
MREQLEAFREEAEVSTHLPAFEDIEQRGRARRRRRHHRTAIVAVAATVLAGTGFWATLHTDPHTVRPADAPTSPFDRIMFIGVEQPPTVTFDWPNTWSSTGWGAANRTDRARNLARFAAVVVERVAKDPCRISRGAPDFRPTATDPQQLAHQLASMARVRVVQAPAPDDRFGLPGIHLRLQGTGPACGGGGDPLRRFVAYQDDAAVGGWPDPLGTADVWVVDAGEHMVLVEAVTGTRVSARDAETLAQVLDSVEIEPS